jgi:hypothetical protein
MKKTEKQPPFLEWCGGGPRVLTPLEMCTDLCSSPDRGAQPWVGGKAPGCIWGRQLSGLAVGGSLWGEGRALPYMEGMTAYYPGGERPAAHGWPARDQKASICTCS